jgi:hypothetical protein
MSGFPRGASAGPSSNIQVQSLGVGVAPDGVAGDGEFLTSLGVATAPSGVVGQISLGGAPNSVIQANGALELVSLTSQVYAIQQLNLNTGLVSSGSAAFTAPAIFSGVAFTPNDTLDTFVQINLAATTLGTLTVTYGPTTGAENTWLPTASTPAGSELCSGLWVPQGWKAIATATGVSVALSASVHKI